MAQVSPVKTVDWQWDIPGVGGAYKVVSTCHGPDRLYLAYNSGNLTTGPGVTVVKDGCARP